MEVVPTGDGEDDDGVIWFRCPQCQGFLPKLSGSDPAEDAAATGDGTDDATVTADAAEPAAGESVDKAAEGGKGTLAWESPADMMAARDDDPVGVDADLLADDPTDDPVTLEPAIAGKPVPKPAPPAEPIAEYAALLAAADQGAPSPYRPWGDYAVGECIHHLAWDDCGVVVAKEDLPGGRKVIKCFFEEAGVVRLIEKAAK